MVKNSIIACLLLLPFFAVWAQSPVVVDCPTCTFKGNSISGGNLPSPTFNNAYHFGDSITAGYETPGYNFTSYPWSLDQAIGVPVEGRVNNGVPGILSNNSDTLIFAAPFLYNTKSLITYTIGTNNIANGVGATALATYLANVEAQSAWWMVPLATKTLFGTGSVTYAGTWTTEAGGYIGKTTAVNGSTATFAGTGTILYVITHASNANASTATLTCDGTATGATLNFAATGGDETQLTRVTGLASGAHSCVVTVTAISGGNVAVEWASFLSGSAVTTTPTLFLGGVPNQSAGANAAAVTSYRTQQQSAVTTLAGDGLPNIYYVDTSTVTTAAAYYNDAFHPDAYGQFLISAPFIAEVNTVFGTSYAGTFVQGPVVDYAKIGGASMVLGNSNLNQATVTGLTRSIAIGLGALNAVTNVQDDTVIGNNAGSALTGNYITAMGSSAGGGALTGTNLGTFFGYTSCGSSTGVQMACFGGQTGGSYTSGGVSTTTDNHDAFFGTGAGKNTASILTDTTALGDSALASASHQMMFGAATVTQNVLHGSIVVAQTTAPTMTAGASAGTTPTCTTIAGSNTSGVLTCTTGTATTTAGTVATITFNGTLVIAPQGCGLTPRNAATILAPVYTTAPSTTTWAIAVGATALTASTGYSWSYLCV